MIKCPKCGAEMPDNAKFCSACGASILPEPGVEVIPPADEQPKAEPKQEKNNSRWSEADIKKMKYEYEQHVRRKRNFSTAGGVLLGVGLVLFVLGFVFMMLSIFSVADNPDPTNSVGIAGMVLGYIGVIFGAIMFPVGIVLLVIANAVFGKKAENRERAIREYEGR